MNTITITRAWLERLLEKEVEINECLGSVRGEKILLLLGYIESAEFFLKDDVT